MSNVSNRYPLSTADGKAIPHAALRPKSLCLLALSTTVSSYVTYSSSVKLLVLISDVDCIIKFSNSTAASVPSNATVLSDSLFLPKNTLMTVAPIETRLSAITIAGTGTLKITEAEPWSGLGLEHQFTRR